MREAEEPERSSEREAIPRTTEEEIPGSYESIHHYDLV